MDKQRGFTLVELMMTVLVAAILMAIAVPGFRTITLNTQQRNAIGDLNTMLSRMRTEAAARHVGVSVCASSDQATCSGTGEWEAGWIMFVDGDPNVPGASFNGSLDTGEQILQVHGALQNNATLRTLGPSSVLSLNSEGLPVNAATNASVKATFRYCDERGLSGLRALVVGAAGVVRMVTDGKDHTGAAITSCT